MTHEQDFLHWAIYHCLPIGESHTVLIPKPTIYVARRDNIAKTRVTLSQIQNSVFKSAYQMLNSNPL